jgi:hypothetical protein
MSKGRSLGFETAYAIVRIDKAVAYESPFALEASGPHIPAGDFRIKIKEVVLTIEEAQNEVGRLNKENKEKGCKYFWQSTHLFLDNGSHGSKDDRKM